MTPLKLTTYRQGDIIPSLPGKSIFHSTELFHVYEKTRGCEPLLIVASRGDKPVGKLLAVIRKSARVFPPSFIRRCEVYENGEFFNEEDNTEDIFSAMLEHLTQLAIQKAFLIEFRNLVSPLFGYKTFRENHYYAVNWLRVHNSLHSKTPEERLKPSRKRQITKAFKNGATIEIAQTEEQITAFYHMLRKVYSSQIRKYFPDLNFFRLLTQQNRQKELARIFLVKYKQKIIGGSLCIYSKENAFLLFSGGMRKTYAWLYPGVLSVWAALEYAYKHHYQHLEFMDAGIPFKPFGYREFILAFGGKQSSTRRWFRLKWDWLNRLACKLYL